MKTFKIRTAKICVPFIFNEHLTNCAKVHSLLEFFSPFMGQHVIAQKSTSSQARSRVRPPSEPCEQVLTVSITQNALDKKNWDIVS